MDAVPYPKVWTEFEAKETKTSDKLVKYRIEDLTEDRFDDAIKHMMENYLLDEPIAVACGKIQIKCELVSRILMFLYPNTDGINNKDFVDDYVRLWRGALKQKSSLVCFREDSDEIVGLNVLTVFTKNDKFMGEILQQVWT